MLAIFAHARRLFLLSSYGTNSMNDPIPLADDAMDRYAAGDNAAFGDVYDALAPRLHRYLLRLTRYDSARAEDLLQQTFLQIHDARGRFHTGSAVAPWAYAIARRLFIDSARRNSREDLSGTYEEIVGHTLSTGPTPEADLEAHRLAEDLRQAIASLPPQQREAFLLVRDEGLSMAEAAEVLGTTVAGVKLRASRAYKALRALFAYVGRDVTEEKAS
jgi:RNA polymerase sigma-70 factor (ECF subfamily)